MHIKFELDLEAQTFELPWLIKVAWNGSCNRLFVPIALEISLSKDSQGAWVRKMYMDKSFIIINIAIIYKEEMSI